MRYSQLMICLIELAGHGQDAIPPLHLAVTLIVIVLSSVSLLSGIWFVARAEGGIDLTEEVTRVAPRRIADGPPLS